MRPGRPAVSIIEVIVGLGMAGIIIASIGNALAAVHRLDTASRNKDRAVAYAKQALEIVSDIHGQQFACLLPGGGTCTNDGGSCETRSAYNLCWPEFPDDAVPGDSVHLPLGNPLHLQQVSGAWKLAVGNDTLGSAPVYTRSIVIDNLPDPAPGNHFNVKRVTVTVTWNESFGGRSISLSTVVSAWKNG